jgi:hypothetical protein
MFGLSPPPPSSRKSTLTNENTVTVSCLPYHAHNQIHLACPSIQNVEQCAVLLNLSNTVEIQEVEIGTYTIVGIYLCVCALACVPVYVTHTSHVLLIPGIARCLTASGVLRIVQYSVLMDTLSESDCVHDKAGNCFWLVEADFSDDGDGGRHRCRNVV